MSLVATLIALFLAGNGISREISGPMSTQTGREAGRKSGMAMTKFSRSADAAEIFALEHRFPAPVAGLVTMFNLLPVASSEVLILVSLTGIIATVAW
jgi:hypothetical protein